MPLVPFKSWSSSTLKIRMVLNYKNIPYTQSYTSYPDICPLLQSLAVLPHTKGRLTHTLPAISHPDSIKDNPTGTMMDSFPIALHLDKTFPSPPLFPSGDASHALAIAVEKLVLCASGKGLFILLPKAINILDARGKDYFVSTRSRWFGKPLQDLEITDPQEVEKTKDALKAELEVFFRMLAGREGKEGPFLEGKQAGYADFILVTFLSWSHRVDKKLWTEIMAMGSGEFQVLWDACSAWMEGQGEDIEVPIPPDGSGV